MFDSTSTTRNFITALVVLICVIVDAECASGQSNVDQSSDRPKVTISKETTWFTEPLNEHGEVDYWEAANQFFSKGTTPESNIVNAIVRVSETGIEDRDARLRFLQRLGIQEDPGQGDLLENYTAYADGKEDDLVIDNTLLELTMAPWSETDYPLAAKWIEKYSPLVDEYVKQLEHKSTFYYPLVAEDEANQSLGQCELDFMLGNDIGMFLAARSQFKLAKGDINGCVTDLLAIRKTAMLLQHSYLKLNAVFVSSFFEFAHRAELQFCFDENTTVMHLKQYRAEAKKYGLINPLPRITGQYDRAVMLHLATQLRNENYQLFGSGVHTYNGQISELAIRSIRRFVDWDFVLKTINERFDQFADVYHDKSTAEMLAGSEQLWHRFNTKTLGVRPMELSVKMLATTGHRKCQLLVDAIEYVVHPTISYDPICNAFIAKKTKEQIIDTTIALRLYHHVHGRYPNDLGELVPKYCPALPSELFNAEPFNYKSNGKHFTLYSIGRNGLDDGGAIDWDHKDITVTSDLNAWVEALKDELYDPLNIPR